MKLGGSLLVLVVANATALAGGPPTDVEPDAVKPDDPPADPPAPPRPALEQYYVDGVNTTNLTFGSLGSARGVAEEFLVLPEGGELGGRLRTITADGGLGTGKLALTDLALLDLNAEWAIAHHYELDVAVSVLPKQPSSTHEHVFQGGSLTLRRDLWDLTALGLSGSASPLLGLPGLAYTGALFLTHKKRLNEIVTFSMAGGASTVVIDASQAMDREVVVEGGAHAAVLARIPNGVWGAWLGAGYALPAYHHGHDPVSGMTADPQPRLSIDLGNAVQLADDWDLTIDLEILDRGDLTNPATRLPVLDGGFDQIQIMVGISRRIHGKSASHDRGIQDPSIQL
jgi:hypothetical protein